MTSIPRVRFDEAKQRVAEKYNRQFRNPFDLEPEEEVLIGQYFKEEYGSDFVFVTHYPSKKRPFYATLCDFFHKLIVVVDSLAACCDFKASEEQVKAARRRKI